MAKVNGHVSAEAGTRTVGRPRVQAALAEIKPRRGPGRPPKAAAAPDAGGDMKLVDASKFMVKPSTMIVKLVGTAPLLVHNFGEKARRMMLEKQMGTATPKREKKDPHRDFVDSLYLIKPKGIPKRRLEPGESWKFIKNVFGFPASAFKNAMVTACKFVEGISASYVKGLIHIHGEFGNLVPIKYKALTNQQDTVRVGRWNARTADIRFRGAFYEWSIELKISYNKRVMTDEQIAMLISNAGFSVGVGEWRPEKGGDFGTFAIE